MEELTIEVIQAQYGSNDYENLKLFEGVRSIGTVRIFGSVTSFRGYVHWLQSTMMAQPDEMVVPFGEAESTVVCKHDLWIVSDT
jgi:hypothetical protein